jgi:hypothetical protein
VTRRPHRPKPRDMFASLSWAGETLRQAAGVTQRAQNGPDFAT